jgi:nitrogen regulatory protein P-II 1
MTKIPVEGHGKQKGLQQQFRGTTFETDFLPKLKIEIVVLDEDVLKLLNAITMAARTGDMGDGKIFVLPVDDAVRIRTGEDRDDAI